MSIQDHSGPRRLNHEHRRQLEIESSLASKVIASRGYYTASKPAEIPGVFSAKQRRRKGMVIPLYSPDSETVSYQLRPDYPTKGGPKYLNPTGAKLLVDIHPMMRDKLKDAREPLLITEGAKTADAVTSRGLCTLLLAGVWNFAVPDTKCRELLPCFDHVPLYGRLVYVAYDADSRTNPDVQEALRRLVARLEERGANVLVIYPPVVNGDPKTGLDDYLAAGGDLDTLLASAEPHKPVDIRRERLSKDEKLRRLDEKLWATWAQMPTATPGQCTDRATVRELIKMGEQSGKLTGGHLKVQPSTRALARRVGISQQAQVKVLGRLESTGLIQKASGHRKPKEAQAYLLTPRSDLAQLVVIKGEPGLEDNETQEHQLNSENQGINDAYRELYPCDNQLRYAKEAVAMVPELRSSKNVLVWERVGDRWQVVDVDHVFRLGKKRGEILRYLVAVFPRRPSIEELFERFASKKARRWDFRRRVLADLEGFRMQRVVSRDGDLNETVRDRLELGPPIIEVVEGEVRLTPEWRENLEEVRTAGREQEDAKLQAEKIAREREKFHAKEKGEAVADKTPDTPKPDKVREILVKAQENDAASRLREQREKAGLPVEDFIRNRLATLGKIRLSLLEEVWRDRGGNSTHVYPTARLMGCGLIANPELQNEVFVYPPAEVKRETTPDVEPLPDNVISLFSDPEQAAV